MSSLRIALLSYRGNPYSGGQGVYVRHLSKALTDLGHRVEVFAGQPYPDLDAGVPMTRLPSLDLYRQDDPFRTPSWREFRDLIDVAEYATMCAAGFPEPLTFTMRAARELRARASDLDVVHDNQSLGYGLLLMPRGIPVVSTIHHPCSIDRSIELEHAGSWKRRLSLRRWYAFTRMQARVARRMERVITVSEAARADVLREFGVPAPKIDVIHNGVDTELFRPGGRPRTPGRIVTTASADVPLKGLAVLLEAVAKLRTERDVSLVVVGTQPRRGPARDALQRFDLGDSVRFVSGVGWDDLVDLYAAAEVAVVPSLYEGFSLPAIEAMACGVPLVATSAGALPEVAGPDGEVALMVPPGDAGALALAIGRILDEPALGRGLGERGRKRAIERFSWKAAAERTVASYRRAGAPC